MKREILFRGLSFSGEWVYGCLIQYENSSQIGVLKYADVMDFVKVRPETVGQFTGLTDKNGKRIFEGDVVKQTGKVNNGSSGAIMVENMRIAVCEINSTGTIMFLSNYRSDIHSSSYEVIGNIHDNPELS